MFPRFGGKRAIQSIVRMLDGGSQRKRGLLVAVGALIVAGMMPASVAAAGQLAPPARRANAYNEALRRGGIEPHSAHPSGTQPYAVCPAPSQARFSCFAAAVPHGLAAQHRSVIGGPLLEGGGKNGGYSPGDLRSAYNLSAQGGSGLTIAITVAHDYPKAESDLAVYRETYGLSPCTLQNGCFRKVNQRGEASNYPEPSEGWSAEAALDLDMTSAICPECKLLLVEADDESAENLTAAVNQAAELGAGVISDSWGGPELSGEASLDPLLDHPGIPVLFASGDSGYRAQYPASSPDVIAVGGTSLRKDASARGWREIAWSGAGSSCSAYEEKPAWQSDLGCFKRTVVDVAAVADPRTPVSVYDTFGVEYKGWELFGGTSAAAPILAGVEAHLSATQRAKGAQLFWEEGPEGKLFDVSEGRNGDCSPEVEYLCFAQLGYDGPTGWGTPGASRPGPPFLATDYPTAVTTTEATLNGAVNPDGEETRYRFEYGATPSYGTSVPAPSADAGPGSAPVELASRLTGLARDHTYHYRLVAENAAGTTYGGDETFETSLWTAQFMPHKEQREEIFGVSCRSASFCMAVGGQGVYYEPPKLYYNEEPLVERWDGSRWAREAMPVYHPAAAGYYSLLAGISCSAHTFCMAVGENYELPVGYGTLTERWNGTEWTLVPAPIPSEAAVNETHQYEVRLHGVSCASESFCALVGDFTKKWNSLLSEEIDGLIEQWDGSKWTVEPSPEPPERGTYILRSVSCVSAEFCIAAGESREAGGTSKTLLERWDGARWSIVSAPATSGELLGVSCISESSCMAVGATNSGAGEEGLAEIWNGTSWSVVPLDWPMRGVSCLAADWCVAAGASHSAHAAFAAIWDGARWLLKYPVTPPDASDTPKELNGVSCESSGCTAVGWYYSWGYRPLVERLDRAFVAPLPSVDARPAAAITPTSATLSALVNNNGGVGSSDTGGKGGSDCHFEVELQSAPGSPVAEPSCSVSPVEGDTSVAVEAQAAALAPNTAYVYRVVASNEGGTSETTPQAQFATLPNPPVAANDPAGSITTTAAMLKAHVDNEGATAGSSCTFVVALQSAPHSPLDEVNCSPNPVTGNNAVAVEASISGLSPNTRYVYRVLAENEGGKSTATANQEFRTLASNSFSIRWTEVRSDGRIVLWVETPSPGSFTATATTVTAATTPPRTARPNTRNHRNRAPRRSNARHRTHPGSHAQRSIPYGTGVATVRTVRAIRLTVKPLRSASRMLKRHSHLRLRIAITFRPDGGTPRTKQVVLSVGVRHQRRRIGAAITLTLNPWFGRPTGRSLSLSILLAPICPAADRLSCSKVPPADRWRTQ